MPCSRTLERRKGANGRGSREAESLAAEGEGSGKYWKALSARSPSPEHMSAYDHDTLLTGYECLHTDIQHQSFGRRLRRIDAKGPHARHDWADEVNVEDGKDIDKVEDDGQAEEAHTPEPRHG